MSWLNLVAAGINTYFSARSKEKEKEVDNEEAFRWGSRRSAFDMELERYFAKQDKAEMRRGANEYAKFSSLDKWAPEYRPTFQPDPVPERPTTDSIKNKY